MLDSKKEPNFLNSLKMAPQVGLQLRCRREQEVRALQMRVSIHRLNPFNFLQEKKIKYGESPPASQPKFYILTEYKNGK